MLARSITFYFILSNGFPATYVRFYGHIQCNNNVIFLSSEFKLQLVLH